jgi:uncharacterized membrane protein
MRTPANIAGHPIHPMLVTIPIGLWIFSLVADLIAMQSAAPQTWAAAAYYTMLGGILGALAAALPGLVDLLSLKDHAIRKTAVTHMGINLSIVALYAINAWLRYTGTAIGGLPLTLSVIAVGLLAVSGWLGGKMVYLAGVAVTPAPEAAADQPAEQGSRAWASYIDGPASGRRGSVVPGVTREGHAFAHGTRQAGDDSDKSNVNRER